MPGLVPGINVFGSALKTWMAGTSPAMTKETGCYRSAVRGNLPGFATPGVLP
jgi:hypothetical protein